MNKTDPRLWNCTQSFDGCKKICRTRGRRGIQTWFWCGEDEARPVGIVLLMGSLWSLLEAWDLWNMQQQDGASTFTLGLNPAQSCAGTNIEVVITSVIITEGGVMELVMELVVLPGLTPTYMLLSPSSSYRLLVVPPPGFPVGKAIWIRADLAHSACRLKGGKIQDSQYCMCVCVCACKHALNHTAPAFWLNNYVFSMKHQRFLHLS